MWSWSDWLILSALLYTHSAFDSKFVKRLHFDTKKWGVDGMRGLRLQSGVGFRGRATMKPTAAPVWGETGSVQSVSPFCSNWVVVSFPFPVLNFHGTFCFLHFFHCHSLTLLSPINQSRNRMRSSLGFRPLSTIATVQIYYLASLTS